ncbi:MAG: hypothetical protein ACYDG3_11165 [Bacillati bacterium]
MGRNRIVIDLKDRQYEELTHIGKSLGMEQAEIARFAVNSFLLSVKQSAIKLFLNDNTKLDEIGVNALKEMYNVDIEQEEKE